MKVIQKLMVLTVALTSALSLFPAARPAAAQPLMTAQQFGQKMQAYEKQQQASVFRDAKKCFDKCEMDAWRPKIHRFIDIQLDTPLALNPRHIATLELMIDTLLADAQYLNDFEIAQEVLKYAREHGVPGSTTKRWQDQINTQKQLVKPTVATKEREWTWYETLPEAEGKEAAAAPRAPRPETPPAPWANLGHHIK